MARKFISLNFHSGADYLNPDWIWEMVTEYYILKFTNINFFKISLSVGQFTAYIWKFGNQDLDGDFAGLSQQDINAIRSFIAAGAGLIYEEAPGAAELYPFEEPTEYDLSPVANYPGLLDEGDFAIEDFINAACKRMTESYHPLTGEELEPNPDRCYGMDALHEYLLKMPDSTQHRACYAGTRLIDWIAAWLCGAERGDFSGPCPFGPNTLPQNPTDNEPPESIWLECYTDDFEETPFYWICGLLTFIPVKILYDDVPKSYSHVNDLDEIQIDEQQNTWADTSLADRAEWLMNYITADEQLADKRVGLNFMSRSCHYAKALWSSFFKGRSFPAIYPYWSQFNIPAEPAIPEKPKTLTEARLNPSKQGDPDGAYGLWKELFEDWLDYMNNPARGNWFNRVDFDLTWLSDRKAKDIVVPQYDQANPPVTIDETRLHKICEYLIDTSDPEKWQLGTNEWELADAIYVNRPPNHVKITVESENEYYSLSEAFWHIASALNDLAEGVSIDYKHLEPVIGPTLPAQPDPALTLPGIPEKNTLYRIFEWWQHDYDTTNTKFSYADILARVPGIFAVCRTVGKVGPERQPTGFPDRRRVMRKVIPLTSLPMIDGTEDLELTAGELLYIFAQALHNYYHTQTEIPIDFFPSHVLPKGHYFNYLRWGRYKNIMQGQELIDLTSWLAIGQRWSMKPAVLQSAYR